MVSSSQASVTWCHHHKLALCGGIITGECYAQGAVPGTRNTPARSHRPDLQHISFIYLQFVATLQEEGHIQQQKSMVGLGLLMIVINYIIIV